MSAAENSNSNDTLFRHGVCAFWATIEIKVKLGRFKFEVHHLTDPATPDADRLADGV